MKKQTGSSRRQTRIPSYIDRGLHAAVKQLAEESGTTIEFQLDKLLASALKQRRILVMGELKGTESKAL